VIEGADKPPTADQSAHSPLPDAQQDIGAEIGRRLTDAVSLLHLNVDNESHQHNVPENSQTHFKVVLVSDDFADLSRIKRHRLVNSLVKDLLAGPIHALTLHLYTAIEWRARFGEAPLSPPCHGGEQAS